MPTLFIAQLTRGPVSSIIIFRIVWIRPGCTHSRVISRSFYYMIYVKKNYNWAKFHTGYGPRKMIDNPLLSSMQQDVTRETLHWTERPPDTRHLIVCVNIGVARYGALGHVPHSTSNCLIFLVTSEPLKHWTLRGCLPRKHILAYSFITVYCRNFVCQPYVVFSLILCPTSHQILATLLYVCKGLKDI